MKLTQTAIPDVVIIEPQVFEDDRGWFMESFNEPSFHRELKKIDLPVPGVFVQDNHSCSGRGVLRGLHYQLPPYAQGKLVRVIQGAAYDVVVDIRKGSATFGNWIGVELSAHNKKMLWIPEGFAHGFVALEENTHFLYKTTDVYDKRSERSLKWDDPEVGIKWPDLQNILINDKDRQAPLLNQAELPSMREQLSKVRLTSLKVIGDQRGSLVSLEQGNEIPFDIKRAYYIFATQADVARGFHAHKNLQQYAICVAGQCTMRVDDGKKIESYILDSPDKGLLISGLIWREMHDFSEGCVLLVFASEHYLESDYIRSYEDFLEVVKSAKE